jgi:hypothetical protein
MITVNQILYILVFISIFLYLLKINRLLYYYLFTCLILVGFVVSKDFSLSIATAGILTALIYVFLDKQIPLRFKKSTLRAIHNAEHYENSSNKKPKKSNKNSKTEEFDTNDSAGENSDDESKPAKKSKKVKPHEEFSDDESEQEDFEPVDNKLNSKESFKTILKSLKSSELSSLNNDTKALIDTQKQLMETLQSMGPALKEGKSILDTFKNYFNDSNLDKLSI